MEAVNLDEHITVFDSGTISIKNFPTCNKSSLLNLANDHALSHKFTKCLDLFILINKMFGLEASDLNQLTDIVIKKCSSDQFLQLLNLSKGGNFISSIDRLFNCSVCDLPLYEPVTAKCGHTFCKSCRLLQSLTFCPECKHVFDAHLPNHPNVHVNVLLSNVMLSWFPKECEAAKLKQKGDKHFSNGEYSEALQSYSKGIKLNSVYTCSLLCDCSTSLMLMNKFTAAENEADKVLKLKPNWFKGYLCKAQALNGNKQYSDSLMSLLKCLSLSPEDSSACQLLSTVILNIISSLTPDNATVTTAAAQNKSKDVLTKYKCKSSLYPPVFSLLSEDIQSLKLLPSKEGDNSLKPSGSLCNEGKFLSASAVLTLDPKIIDCSDFECPLCFRLLFEPITTPCGHSFCLRCIYRCLDHNSSCPICKHSLSDFLAERCKSTTFLIEKITKEYLSENYAERMKQEKEELSNVTLVSNDSNFPVIPIFVCTLAFPTMPCPLHIFEPKYRLMIRRCIEYGSRTFGMCAPISDDMERFSEYGTTLEIGDIQYLQDGRSILSTTGRKRFKVLEHGVLDGYKTGKVEFITDQAIEDSSRQEILLLHQKTRDSTLHWLAKQSDTIRSRITDHYGNLPDLDDDPLGSPDGPAWLWWCLAVLPLDNRVKLAVLKSDSLKERLAILRQVLDHLQRQNRAVTANS